MLFMAVSCAGSVDSELSYCRPLKRDRADVTEGRVPPGARAANPKPVRRTIQRARP